MVKAFPTRITHHSASQSLPDRNEKVGEIRWKYTVRNIDVIACNCVKRCSDFAIE